MDAGSFQRWTDTSASELLQKAKSKRLAIPALKRKTSTRSVSE